MSPSFRTTLFPGACFVAAFALVAPASAQTISTTFDGGVTNGWQGPQGLGGSTSIDTTLGNPAPSLRTQFNNFGITFYNDSDPGYVRDYSQAPFTFSVDALTQVVNFFGTATSRDLVLEFRDYDNAGSYPWVSVWYDLGDLVDPAVGGTGQWESYSVTVTDPTSTTLPPGWGGTGDEDPVTFEPRLPANRTFADVLAGVDEVALTTLTPGFVYGFTDFDVALDNINLTIIPEPAGLALLVPAAALLMRRRR